MSANDEVMKAIEDIASGKVEEQVIWQKKPEGVVYLEDLPDNVVFEEPDPLEYATQMGLVDEPVMHPLRAHDEENHENCWCHKKLPLIVHGHEVGVAVPLENGDYSMIFDDSNAGRLVKTLIDMGTENSFSIQNDQGILDLGEED